MITPALLRRLPKTDLHVHLDGSLRLPTLVELARERDVSLPSYTPEGLCEQVFKPSYRNLEEYLRGFAYTSAVLQDPEALRRCAYELARDCIDEGVRYIEVRLAPQLHVNPNQDVEDVLVAVWEGLRRAEAEHAASDAVRDHGEPPFRAGIIACALRMFEPQFSWYYDHLSRVLAGLEPENRYGIASLQIAHAAVHARDELGVPVVGFDLAGQEYGYPAEDHREAYRFAHDHFLSKTVHAGEAYGPESIFQAITALHAERIGHGYHLFSAHLVDRTKVPDPERFVRDLVQYIADRRITVEVCITSNLQTNPQIGEVENHAFRKMLDARLSTTFCTDNRLVSHTSVSQEIQRAVEHFHLDLHDLRNCIIYGFKRSFFPGEYREKRRYVRGVIDYYDRTVQDWQARQA